MYNSTKTAPSIGGAGQYSTAVPSDVQFTKPLGGCLLRSSDSYGYYGGAHYPDRAREAPPPRD
eukprot:1429252-Prymnesium_polylepis.1